MVVEDVLHNCWDMHRSNSFLYETLRLGFEGFWGMPDSEKIKNYAYFENLPKTIKMTPAKHPNNEIGRTVLRRTVICCNAGAHLLIVVKVLAQDGAGSVL